VNVPLLRSELLAAVPGIAHGFTTRDGGVSKGPMSALNLAHRVGDEKETVELNRRAVLGALGRPDAAFVSVHQVHGDTVVEVNHQAARSIEADALWTRDPRAAVAVLVADCVPILIAHKLGKAVAAVHAGWRGTRARVASAMVERLAGAGFAAADLVVALGPAIGPCCFEIGADVADQLRQAFPGVETAVRTDGERIVADLWELNRRALMDAGVPETSIERLDRCTSCGARLFSHRRDQGSTGRQAGIIALSPKRS
jgi:polyphenol oxidase